MPLFRSVHVDFVAAYRVLAIAVCAAILPFLLSCGNGGEGVSDDADRTLNEALASELTQQGFTGRIASTLESRLGRPVNTTLADLGRLLFFDTVLGLHDDNACAGCHSPAVGMGDSQSIAIGVQNNGTVGPGRTGPRNQRRSPTVVNSAFSPSLMWNGRFFSPANDPFTNSQGFVFPAPEGTTVFPPNHPTIRHLLVAQAHLPSTELVEMAGFTGVNDLGTRFLPFDDGRGSAIPPADASGFRNKPIRQAVLQRLNTIPGYRTLFGTVFPAVAGGAPIDFAMVGQAIAEFEFTLVRANAPLDRFARGEHSAMTTVEKRGAQLFFGKGGCVTCHAVKQASNEMFSDFQMHNIGVPQLAPLFGVGTGNVIFDGAGENEDFGLAQITGQSGDRYKFRSSPLRNVSLQPTFFHNGAFTKLDDAIGHHLNVVVSARSYNPQTAGVGLDIHALVGPIEPVLATLDPLVQTPIQLTTMEFADLVTFVRTGLLDPQAEPTELCRLVPLTVPSGRARLTFQGC